MEAVATKVRNGIRWSTRTLTGAPGWVPGVCGASPGGDRTPLVRSAADEDRAGLYTPGVRQRTVGRDKFDSGWPSFYEAVRPGAVELLEDRSLGVVRTEVRCSGIASRPRVPHGFGTPTGEPLLPHATPEDGC